MSHSDHPINDFATAVGADGQLVDVREPDEVAGGSLPGAVNIPVGEIAGRTDELDKGRRVVVFCQAGGRSTNAAEALTEAGFDDVVNLTGGMGAFGD